MKISYMNHLWYLKAVVKITKKRVIEVIGIFGIPTNLLRGEEEYILVTVEMEGAHGLQKDEIRLAEELQ